MWLICHRKMNLRGVRTLGLGAVVALGAAALVGCKGKPKTDGPGSAAAGGDLAPAEAAASAASARRAERAPQTNERISIPAGSLVAGSTPGDDGRDPAMEPVLLDVELGGYEIDKLPYPNDPTKPPRTDITREDARAACQERGQRLCTELEWEHACKGAQNEPYAAGNGWDPVCAKDPNSCASGFGVLAMGGAIREWTANDFQSDDKPRPIVRGATASAEPTDHRCAHRAAAEASTKAGDLGFRCCKGAANAAAIPPFKTSEAAFGRIQLDPSRITKLVAAVPRLAPFAKEISYFPEEEAIKTVLARGDAGTKPGPALTTAAVTWTPLPNEEVVALAVKSKAGTLLLAFYHLPGDRYRLASSLVLKEESGPVVLVLSNFNKKRIGWTTCWECQGESGAFELRENRRVVIVQH
jgi:hypothetical protein